MSFDPWPIFQDPRWEQMPYEEQERAFNWIVSQDPDFMDQPPEVKQEVRRKVVREEPQPGVGSRFLENITGTIGRGLYGAAEGAWRVAENVSSAAERAAGETPMEAEARGSLVEKLRQASQGYQKYLEENKPKESRFLPPAIASTAPDVISAAGQLPMYAILPGGPVTGFAALSGLEKYGQGGSAWESAKAAGLGALQGAALEATGGAPLAARLPAMGALGGTMAYAEGAPKQEVTKNAVVMSLLSMLGSGRSIKGETAARIAALDPRLVDIAPDIKDLVDQSRTGEAVDLVKQKVAEQGGETLAPVVPEVTQEQPEQPQAQPNQPAPAPEQIPSREQAADILKSNVPPDKLAAFGNLLGEVDGETFGYYYSPEQAFQYAFGRQPTTEESAALKAFGVSSASEEPGSRGSIFTTVTKQAQTEPPPTEVDAAMQRVTKGAGPVVPVSPPETLPPVVPKQPSSVPPEAPPEKGFTGVVESSAPDGEEITYQKDGVVVAKMVYTPVPRENAGPYDPRYNGFVVGDIWVKDKHEGIATKLYARAAQSTSGPRRGGGELTPDGASFVSELARRKPDLVDQNGLLSDIQKAQPEQPEKAPNLITIKKRPDLGAAEVIDNSDPSLLTVRLKNGSVLKVGRGSVEQVSAVSFPPPELPPPAPEQPPQPAQAMLPPEAAPEPPAPAVAPETAPTGPIKIKVKGKQPTRETRIRTALNTLREAGIGDADAVRLARAIANSDTPDQDLQQVLETQRAMQEPVQQTPPPGAEGAIKGPEPSQPGETAPQVTLPGRLIAAKAGEKGGEAGFVRAGIVPDLFQGVREKVLTPIHYAITQDAVPRLADLGHRESATEHASARIAAPRVVEQMLSQMFPDTYKTDPTSWLARLLGGAQEVTPEQAQAHQDLMRRTTDVLNADNILGGYDAAVQRARDAESPQAKQAATKQAFDILEAHSLPELERTVREGLQDPQIKVAIERKKQFVDPVLNQMWLDTHRGISDSPPERGRSTGSRINLLTNERAARLQKALSDPNAPMPEAQASSYRRPNVKADPFERRASFTGDYSNDLPLNLMAVIGPRYNEVTKLRLYDDLVAKGNAVWGGKDVEVPEGYAPLSVKVPVADEAGSSVSRQERTLYVKSELVPEIRQVLGTDTPGRQNAFTRAFTDLQLAQVSDLVTHSKNTVSNITRAQGAGSVWADVIRKIPGVGTADALVRIVIVSREVVQDSPKIRAEIADMAKKGLIRPDFPKTGVQKITHAQGFLHELDTTARIVMNRFYDNLVERKLALPDPAERMKFVDQGGQYNTRLIGRFSALMKQWGFSPFLTAGRNFNRQGLRWLTGNPGFKPASPSASAHLRALNIAGTVATFTLPMMLNAITTGKVTGRPGTPLGAWDLGTEDKRGKHRVIDLLQIVGARRGLRLLGLDALASGVISRQNVNTVAGNMKDQILSTISHPWMGPGLALPWKAATGLQFDLRGKMEARKIPEGGIRQTVENTRAALASQNPLLYSLARPLAVAAGYDLPPNDEAKSTVWGTTKDFLKTALKSPEQAFGMRDVRPDLTAAQDLARKYALSKLSESMTMEEVSKINARYDTRAAMARGEKVEIPPTFSRREVQVMRMDAKMPTLARDMLRLEADQAMKVWKQANPEEKKLVRGIYINKLINALKNSRDSEERTRLIAALRGARSSKD